MSDSTQLDQDQIENKPADTIEAAPKDEITYTKAEMDKIISEAKKYRGQADDYKKQIKKRELDELEKNNEWQNIAKIKSEEAETLRAETEKLKTAFVTKEKMSAVKEAAMLAGLRKESIQDLRLIDFPEIRLETNSEGEFTVSGADKAVLRLKSLRPHWFNNAAPQVNTQTPAVTNSGSNISWADFKKIEAEYKKTPNRENEQKLRLAYSKVSSEK